MLTYPEGLRPIGGGYAPMMQTLGGGQSLSGFEQVVTSYNDRWQASFTFAVRKTDDLLALRGFVTGMRGRSNTVLLPAFDRGRGPYGNLPIPSPIGTTYYSVLFYEDVASLAKTAYRFSLIQGMSATAVVRAERTVRLTVTGGTPAQGMWVKIAGVMRRLTDITLVSGSTYDAFVNPGFTLSAVSRAAPAAYLADPALLGVTQVYVVMTAGGVPKPGQFFSLGNRMYSIDSVTGTPSEYTVKFWPRLRFAAEEGEEVNFVSPACAMRFATDGEGADVLKGLDLLKFGQTTLNFEEAAVTTAGGVELREDGGYELRE